jgi:IstB-like ATP binding protein
MPRVCRASAARLPRVYRRAGRVVVVMRSPACHDGLWPELARIGFAQLDDTGAQLLFRLVSAGYERRDLGVGSRAIDQWARFLPEHITTVGLLDRLLHANVVVADGDSCRMRQAGT